MTRGRYDAIISFYVSPDVLRELENRRLVEFAGDYKPGTDRTPEYQFMDLELLNEGLANALRMREERIREQTRNTSV